MLRPAAALSSELAARWLDAATCFPSPLTFRAIAHSRSPMVSLPIPLTVRTHPAGQAPTHSISCAAVRQIPKPHFRRLTSLFLAFQVLHVAMDQFGNVVDNRLRPLERPRR